MLAALTFEDDVVVAEVPETRMQLVHLGQSCEARFVSLPGEVFRGTVISLSPILTQDRRTLRVLFILKDLEDRLRPGMFAEIGLGTDAHGGLTVPANGVLHVGRSDYALQQSGSFWRIVEVHLGELRGTNVQILSGVASGDRVLGKGAILLKPLVVRSLRMPPRPEAVAAPEGDRN